MEKLIVENREFYVYSLLLMGIYLRLTALYIRHGNDDSVLAPFIGLASFVCFGLAFGTWALWLSRGLEVLP
jgi:hypothetical protein